MRKMAQLTIHSYGSGIRPSSTPRFIPWFNEEGPNLAIGENELISDGQTSFAGKDIFKFSDTEISRSYFAGTMDGNTGRIIGNELHLIKWEGNFVYDREGKLVGGRVTSIYRDWGGSESPWGQITIDGISYDVRNEYGTFRALTIPEEISTGLQANYDYLGKLPKGSIYRWSTPYDTTQISDTETILPDLSHRKNPKDLWSVFMVDNSVKAKDIVNQWLGTITPSSLQSWDVIEDKKLDITASSWSGQVRVNRVVKATDNGDVLEGKQRDSSSTIPEGSVLSGGKGNDRIQGKAGWDIADGGEGNDLVKTGNGRDILTGGLGSDELWGGFGWNTFRGDRDGSADLLVIKSDQWMVNPRVGTAGNNANGSKCDIIEDLDAIDKIIIQGVATSDLRFNANVSGQGLSGIGIYADGSLEALYTGGDLTVAQLTAMTTGDLVGQGGPYWDWG